MKQFHAVIFDMDGLLLDTERLALDAFHETCDHFGIGVQTELFERCIGLNPTLGDQVLKEGLEGIVDYMDFGQLWNTKYSDRTTNNIIPLKSGVVKLLKYLMLNKIPAAVATSSRYSKAKQKLQATHIFEMFDAVIGGDQVTESKPYPDIYLKAAEAIGVSPEKCLALEDSENGVRSAFSAGMTVIQIPDLVLPSPELQALGHIVLNSLDDVVNYIADIS